MRKTKYVIELTDTERQYAQKVINNKTTAPTFKKRAQIVLALDTNVGEPATQMEIARRVDGHIGAIEEETAQRKMSRGWSR